MCIHINICMCIYTRMYVMYLYMYVFMYVMKINENSIKIDVYSNMYVCC